MSFLLLKELCNNVQKKSTIKLESLKKSHLKRNEKTHFSGNKNIFVLLFPGYKY